MTSPGFSGAVRSSITLPWAVADVITVKSDKLFAGFRRLLLFTELVVFPSALVLPQLPVSAFRPGDRWVHRKRENYQPFASDSTLETHLKLIPFIKIWFYSSKDMFSLKDNPSGLSPLLLCSLASHVMLKEKAFSGDVGWILPVLIIIQFLAFTTRFILRVFCAFL